MANNIPAAPTQTAAPPAARVLGPPKLLSLAALPDERPDWPFSPWWTGELIRRKKLGCVRSGRRVFVTDDLLSAFIAANTVTP